MTRFDLSQVRSDYQEGFVSEIADTFEGSINTVSAICGPDNTRAFFRSAIYASQDAGFQLRGEIVKYGFLSLHLGLLFATDPLYEDIRISMLWDHPGVHPNVGLNRMFRSTDLMIAEGICADRDGVAPGFGAACRATMGAGGGDPWETALRICQDANPKRFQAFGAEAVHRSLATGSYDPRLAQGNAEFKRDWSICTYHLGMSFERNPLFSWVPDVLIHRGLPEVGSMLDG
ncbi:MAG: hypothetical protein Q4G25_06415 [Paracoccus sp. (in: a-proteobacteria)]|nr:hypothetical protein [Paracoccus sp. (in: a-proteobacteria)]